MRDSEKDGNSTRWKIDGDDKKMLEQEFLRKRFPSPRSKKRMADQLNVEPRRIQVWFQNRRQREKGPEDEDQPPAGPAATGSHRATSGSSARNATSRTSSQDNSDNWLGAYGMNSVACPPPQRGASGNGSRSRAKQQKTSGGGSGSSGAHACSHAGCEDTSALHDMDIDVGYDFPPQPKLASHGGRGLGAGGSAGGSGAHSHPPRLSAANHNSSCSDHLDEASVLANPSILGSSDDIVYALMDFDKGPAPPEADGDSLWAMQRRGSSRSLSAQGGSGLFGSSGSLVALEELCGGSGTEAFDDMRDRDSATGGEERREGSRLGRTSSRLGGGSLPPSVDPSPLVGPADDPHNLLGMSFHSLSAPFQQPAEAEAEAASSGSAINLQPAHAHGRVRLEANLGGPTPSESSNEGTSTAWGSRATPTPQEAMDFGPSAFASMQQLIPPDSAAATALLEAAARGNYALLGGFAASAVGALQQQINAQQTSVQPMSAQQMAASVQQLASAHPMATAQGTAAPISCQQGLWIPTATALPTTGMVANAPAAAAVAPVPLGCGTTAAVDASATAIPLEGDSTAASAACASAAPAAATASLSAAVNAAAATAMATGIIHPQRNPMAWDSTTLAPGESVANPVDELDYQQEYEIPQQLITGANAMGDSSGELNSWSNAAAAVNAVLSTARQQYSLAMGRPLPGPSSTQSASYRKIATPSYGYPGAGGVPVISDGHVRGGRALGQSVRNATQGAIASVGGQTTTAVGSGPTGPGGGGLSTTIGQGPLRSSRLPYRSDELPPPLAMPQQLLEQQLQLQQATQLQQLQQQMLLQQQAASAQSHQMQALVQAQILQHREQLQQQMQQQEVAQGQSSAPGDGIQQSSSAQVPSQARD